MHNKLLYFLFTLACIFSISQTQAQERLLAFPGADGYGRYVTGGRGGEVCYVTRTDDCTDDNLVPGTLRWALRHNNGGRPRTILFNTSGTIYLTSKLKFQYGDVSILGQSAPGGGVCVTGYNMYICRDNVIVRHMRFRAGDIPDKSMTGLDMENAKRVILDHCSMTWSMEECLTAYDTDSTTVQWCIIGEGLYNSKNDKGARAYATQWGGEHSTMHHTLITNSHSRAPRFNGVRAPSAKKGDHDYQVDSEFANNVVFNWSGSGNQYGGEYDKAKVEVNAWCMNDHGYNRVYLMHNYYRPGPATKRNCGSKRYWCAPSTPYGQWYLEGNKFEVDGTYSSKNGVWSKAELDKVNADNYYGAESGNNSRGINLTGSNFTKYTLTALPYSLSGMQYEEADAAYQKVVNQAGASLPRYDEVDRRLIDEAAGRVEPRFAGPSITQEPGIIDSPDDIELSEHDTYYVDGKAYCNFPFLGLRPGDRYMIDSDADGLPDSYEDEMGLDKYNDADGAAYASNGYTHLENYMNGIADSTIDKASYETSETPVEPGLGSPDALVTVSFVKSAGEGQAPASVSLKRGEGLIIPTNTTLYRDNHTLTGWSSDDQTYQPGQHIAVMKDMVLTSVYTRNNVSLSDRTHRTILTWDFTLPSAPLISADSGNDGIYVSQNKVEGQTIDTRIYYEGDVIMFDYLEGVTAWVDGQQVELRKTDDDEFREITATGAKSLQLVYPGQEEDPFHPGIDYDCAPYHVAVHDADQLLVALQAATQRANKEERYLIFLHNGTYDLGTVAKTAIPAMTSLIGQSQEGVLIMNNPGKVNDYQNQTPVLFIDQNQNDVYLQDLTIRQARDWEGKKSQGQALAMRQRGKRAVYKNVTLQGVQDTYYLNKADATAYFEDCDVSGEVDFIYGDGTMWFEQCTLRPLSSGACITAPNTQTGYRGIVFNHCTIDGASGYRLGRPWGDSPAATYLYTTMLAEPTAAGWGSMTSGLKVRFHEYGSMNAQGEELDLSQRSISACSAVAGSDAPVLTAQEAEAYTIASTFKDWDPQERARQLDAPEIDFGATIDWMPIDGAIGYVMLLDDKVIQFCTVNQAECNPQWEGKITIRAINAMGGLGMVSNTLDFTASIEAIQADRPSTARLYNLHGHPVAAPTTPGIYISNGRKVYHY